MRKVWNRTSQHLDKSQICELSNDHCMAVVQPVLFQKKNNSEIDASTYFPTLQKIYSMRIKGSKRDMPASSPLVV